MLTRIQNGIKKAGDIMTQRPLITFFILLLALLGLILIGHFSRLPEEETPAKTAEKKETTVFVPSQNVPTLLVPAEVKKDRLLTLSALAPGIVSNIYIAPGKKIIRGQVILEITSDYVSGRAGLSVALEAAERARTLELADIDKKIFSLEERRIKRDSTLSGLEEEIELRRLKKDRETRSSDLETSRLELEIARRNDAALKPRSLVSGTVENIAVERGDYVTPGTALATLRSESGALTVETLVGLETAKLVDPSRSAILEYDGQTADISPLYLSQGENSQGLFSVAYTLPETLEKTVADGSFVKIRLPLRPSTAGTLLVPIDALFQDTARAWVLTEKEGKAESREVTLGRLYGSFAEITGGLETDARIILNRSIISGDAVSIR